MASQTLKYSAMSYLRTLTLLHTPFHVSRCQSGRQWIRSITFPYGLADFEIQRHEGLGFRVLGFGFICLSADGGNKGSHEICLHDGSGKRLPMELCEVRRARRSVPALHCTDAESSWIKKEPKKNVRNWNLFFGCHLSSEEQARCGSIREEAGSLVETRQ